MDLMVKQGWTSTGASGGLAAIEVPAGMCYATLYATQSTLATTQSISWQVAQQSTGPWFIEASTAMPIGNVSTAYGSHITGPMGPYVRPYLHTASTGNYAFLLIGVG